MMTDTTSALQWDRPGPGSWELDSNHLTGPMSTMMIDIFEDGFNEGFRTLFARYGMPLSQLSARQVNRRIYLGATVYGAPERDGGPPPAVVLRLLTRLVPKLRRRFAIAKEAVAEERWLADAQRWEDERPGWVARFDALAAVDPDRLDDIALAEHIGAALDAAADGMRAHFEHNGPLFGVGRYLAELDRYGVEAAAAATTLEGASPGSGADGARSLTEIRAAVLEAGQDPAELRTYDDIRAVGPVARDLLDRHLRRHGLRVLGNDLGTPLAADHESLLVRAVAEGIEVPDADAGLRALPAVLAAVPESARAEIERLAHDARRCYRTLDDQSSTLAAWSGGIATRAVRVAATRLLAAGRIPAADAVLDLRRPELDSLLRDGSGPSSADLADRAALRARIVATEAPAQLGPAAVRPDPAVFPPAVRTLLTAIDAALAAKFGRTDTTATPQADLVQGEGIGRGLVRGRAVVAAEVDDIDELGPGDVLVTTVTTPGWCTVLPTVGGLVTEIGGPLSHPAVVARELGLPAVLGVRGATDLIPDGALVELDAAAGTVRIVHGNERDH